VSLLRRTFLATLATAALVSFMVGTASAATPSLFFNGFEVDTSGWEGPITRVPSGTDGITSADGEYHAEVGEGAFTRWGGYTNEFPPSGYSTSIDVYLGDCPADDSRVDWSSAISDTAAVPSHRRDFIFNFGCYIDEEGDTYWVFSASNNAPGFPKNPGRDPYPVDEEGWYTLQHVFYDNGSGVLAVDLNLIDAGGEVLHSWTLSDPTDVIGETVGGNRYGWFVTNELEFLAVDNSRLDAAVGPPTSVEECKKGGWEQFNNPTFKNQGDCVSYVVTGGRNPAAG
jgi:hypothetical protein